MTSLGGGFPVFRRRVAPRPGSVLIILSKNMVKNMRVRPVIANRFFDALRIRIYALRNTLRVFTVFYGGVNDLSILILYAAKFDRWVVGPL